MDNRTIAQQLMRQARCLGDQHASLYRARAYRRAAETVLGLDEPVEHIVSQRGLRGLKELPGIGAHIARTLETLVHTGALPTLNPVTPKVTKDNPTTPRDESAAADESRGSNPKPCNDFAISSP